MDRLGARRVMLFCTAAAALLPLAYPLAPGIWALIFLQLFLGLAESMGWLGAQTMIGQYMHGRTTYAGRLSFVIRFGQLVAPPMAGVTWDLARRVGRVHSHVAVGVGQRRLRAACCPCRTVRPASGAIGHPGERACAASCRDGAITRVAFGLLAAPSVAIIVALGALMHMGNSVQSSFYVAWLTEMGITGTAVGLLSPAGAVGAALFSLMTAPLMRYVSGFWIVLLSLWAGILLICATPLLGAYLLLQIAMFLRSGMNGLAQPLVITLVLRGAGRSNQGKAVGLRGTANRSGVHHRAPRHGRHRRTGGRAPRVLPRGRPRQPGDDVDRDLPSSRNPQISRKSED